MFRDTGIHAMRDHPYTVLGGVGSRASLALARAAADSLKRWVLHKHTKNEIPNTKITHLSNKSSVSKDEGAPVDEMFKPHHPPLLSNITYPAWHTAHSPLVTPQNAHAVDIPVPTQQCPPLHEEERKRAYPGVEQSMSAEHALTALEGDGEGVVLMAKSKNAMRRSRRVAGARATMRGAPFDAGPMSLGGRGFGSVVVGRLLFLSAPF